MSARIRWLGALLVVQIALGVLLWWPRDAGSRSHALVPLEPDAITRVSIGRKPVGDAKLEPVVLTRGEGGWSVESAQGYPADAQKITTLLEALTGLHAGPPIATQPTSWDALGVGEKEYGRRVEVKAGDQSLVLVLGAATSNSVRVRIEGKPEVWLANGVSEWSIRDSNSAYYDPIYVDEKLGDLTGLSLHNENGEIDFVRDGDAWTLSDLAEGESTNPDAIEMLLGKLVRVRMTAPVADKVADAYGLDGQLGVRWTVAAKDQSVQGGYEVGAEEGPDRYVKALDRPWVVKARAGGFDALRKARREDLVRAAAAPASTAP